MFKKAYAAFVPFIFVLCAAGLLAAGDDLQKLVGKKLPAVKLLTLDNNEKWVPGDIPQLGKEVLSIMYTDADKSDMNDPLSDAIKARDYDKSKYHAIGIGNSKDAPWIMDKLIRSIAKSKMKKYKGSVILLDEELIFAKALNLGDCNNRAVVIIVDKTGRIVYVKKIGSEKESRAMTNEVIPLLDKLLK
ncbi:MAG: hypothetical protein JW807_14820 [Spirochaetes bacterium]|nr:hypothetical protein [Spirochaetota bacterium]